MCFTLLSFWALENGLHNVSFEGILTLGFDLLNTSFSRHFAIPKVVVVATLQGVLEFFEALLGHEDVVCEQHIRHIKLLSILDLDILDVFGCHLEIVVFSLRCHEAESVRAVWCDDLLQEGGLGVFNSF